MEISQEQQKDIAQFEQFRRQLGAMIAQKQQFAMQIEASNQALEELEKTTEKDAFRAIGTVIVKLPVSKIKTDLTEEKSKLEEQMKLIDAQVKRF